ncbi:hypothetical protein MANES_12G116050v8 [Manihot esculenta]|uniref:Uncharacterized protein n=1 Tax=Manihot esculenta TaxID=3983 RepID=A0ACB7GS08_MANES|nr:hypothetical protein MANES_12G116050v8 [Manihot esculenta]
MIPKLFLNLISLIIYACHSFMGLPASTAFFYYYYFINAHCIAFEKIHKINYKRTKNIQINQSNQNKKQNSKPIKANKTINTTAYTDFNAESSCTIAKISIRRRNKQNRKRIAKQVLMAIPKLLQTQKFSKGEA